MKLMKSSSRRIFVVDDDQDNLTLVASALRHEGHEVETASCGEEALEKLGPMTPDLVLLDINMPGISGYEILTELRKREPYVSVIFVSGRSSSSDVVQGLDAGADDYVCKPFNPHVLLARVRAQLRIKDLHDSLCEANTRLLELVDIDDLTGLYNMRSIYHKLDGEIARGRRYGRAVGVVMMDMDNFKNVNDTNDHLFGSFVLSEVGKIIRGTIRQEDFAARYGGDEFLIALSETSVEGARSFADRLRKAIEAYSFSSKGSSMRLSASLGVSVCEPQIHDIDARNLVRFADNALYVAKRNGKNCVRSYDMAKALLKKTS